MDGDGHSVEAHSDKKGQLEGMQKAQVVGSGYSLEM